MTYPLRVLIILIICLILICTAYVIGFETGSENVNSEL